MKFKSNEIESITNEMENVIKKIQQDFTEIKKIKTTLDTHTYWQGMGSNHYNDKFKNIVNQFDDIISDLNSTVEYLRKITDGYKQLDKKVVLQAKEMIN